MLIKNFLSIGESPLEFNFKSGLNIITGINLDKDDSKNGVGKSAIADALFFVLFGNTIRDLKKDQIVNNINKKHCEVKITFDVIEHGAKKEYEVLRGINPTKIQLYEDGEDVTKSSIPKTTAEVCKIISSTQKVFEHSVLMSVNNTVPFMAQKKVDKRKFIEGILLLGVFSDMLLTARHMYNDSKKDNEIELTKLEEVNKTHDIYINQKEKQEKQKQYRIEDIESRVEENNSKMVQLKDKIKSVSKTQITSYQDKEKNLAKHVKKCSTGLRKIDKNIANYESDINHNVERINDLIELGDSCIICKRPYTAGEKSTLISERKKLKDKNKKLESKIKEQNKKLKQVEDLKEKCENGIEKIKQKINDNIIKINENKNIKSKVKSLEDYNKRYASDIKKIINERDEYDELISDTQSRIDTLEEQLKKIKLKLDNLDVVKFIVSEEGVKSFIVKKILKLLNGKLTYYLKKLDAPCVCQFNEYFEESIINDKGQVCSYHNFSGGERRRIDLAILFTFMDIRKLQANVLLNVSFYDEILDSSLDTVGIDLFLDTLNERSEKNKESIYIITHQLAAIKKLNDLETNIINLEKSNGFTRLVE